MTLQQVAYIDTEGTFRPDRIRAIAERFNVDADAALENIVVVRFGAFSLVPFDLTRARMDIRVELIIVNIVS